MSNRTAIIASAFMAGIVSILSITSPVSAAPAANEAAPAADECLAAPKATTPAGAHWYYRVEKGTKRKCWYLADEVAKASKPAATTPSPVAETHAPAPPTKPMQKSVANARAELTAGSPDEDRSLSESTWPPLTPSDQAAVRDDNQAAAIQPAPQVAADAQGWNIASRWPESKTIASAEEQPATTAPEPARPPTPALTPDRLAAAGAVAATPAPVAQPQPANAVPAADADDTSNFTIRVLLSILVGLLALAAIIGPMIFRYVRPRREERTSAQRRPIWDMNTSGGIIRQDNPRMSPPAQYADRLPEPRVLDEAVDELENLLARASKRSAA
jgi:hypothetical protein